eukprot:2502503-Prymnesium_polylepis.1
MAGQFAGTHSAAGRSLGNEDVTVRSITLEIYGCPAADCPVCGDGIVTAPEKCDDGTNPQTGQNENGYGMCLLDRLHTMEPISVSRDRHLRCSAT